MLIPLVATGCGSDGLFLGFPPAPDAKSMVVAQPVAGDVELTAVDIEGSASNVRVELDSEEPSGRGTYAMLFRSPLSAYGVDEGPLRVSIDPDGSVAFLGSSDALFGSNADRVFAARIYQEQGAADWEAIAEVPSWVAQRRLALPPPRCPEFVPDSDIVQLDGYVLYAIALEDRAVLLRIEGGETYVVTADATTPISPPGSFVITSATQTVEGRVWLGSDVGEVWSARPNTTNLLDEFVSLGATGLAAPIESLAVGGSDIFAVAYSGDVAHFDGTSWKRVARLGRDRRGEIVRTGDGEAMLLAAERPGLHVITRDDVGFDTVRDSAPQSIANIDGLGTLVGTDVGGFYRRDGAGWTVVDNTSHGFWSASMLSYDGGFIFHLASGVGGYYHDGLEPCDDLFVTGLLVESRLIAQGRDILSIHLTSDALRTVITRLRRR